MLHHYFITGTDTGCGKTLVTTSLLRLLQARGIEAQGMKPVASGAVATRQGLRNEDAQAIRASGGNRLPYALVNPCCFGEPVAPSLAAASAGQPIEAEPLHIAFAQIAATADLVLVEGVGGWRVPWSDRLDAGEFCRQLGLPVILVVGLRLGCINHALLSAEAIERDGLQLAGWIANQTDPAMARAADNIALLESRIAAPLLGRLPWQTEASLTALQQQLAPAIGLLTAG